MALDGGEKSALGSNHLYTSRKETLVPIRQETGLAPELIWMW